MTYMSAKSKTSSKPTLTTADIDHIAKLANLPLTPSQAADLTQQLGTTVSYVSKLQELPTDGVEETSQVTGLENIWREDAIDLARIFTQEEALSGAKRTHNGFFVVDAVLEEK
jgi:aspartyl-tRNA(Asn)/glutamyl-tRNA(Gln) amidotransferase subunit C